MSLVSYWRRAWKRNSVRAHYIGFAVSFIGGVWAALPGAWVDRLPAWLLFAVPCAISALGLVGSYVAQPNLPDDARG